MWQTLCAWRLRGNWKPGGYNVVLLITQVVLLWTAAQRGMDYLTLPDLVPARIAEGSVPSALRGIEADISLNWLGLAFLIPAGAAFVGLATGWAKLLSLGHLFVGASYLVLGITFLRDSPVDDWLTAFVGCALLVAAAFLLVADSRQIPDVLAISLGIVFMVTGGWLAAQGLGYGYRTGNGFVGGAVLHFVMGFGTQIMARREERLRREEEEDFQELRQRG
jgi:hypothetical protein